MERRNFLIGMGAASAAGGALLGSGAFSSVESDRYMQIEVAEDPDAYLGLDACDSSHGENYVEIDGDGHLGVDISENPNGGEGVNSNSRTWFDDVFQLCNQGTDTAYVWIQADDGWPTVGDGPHEGEPRVDFYLDDDGDRESIVGAENARAFEVGDCECVGIRTNTHGIDATEDEGLLEAIGDTVTVVADVEPPTPDPETAFFEVGDLDPQMATVESGESFDISATVTNTGGAAGQQDVELLIDGDLVDSETLSVDPTDPETVTFEDVSIDDLEEGEYEYKIASEDDDATGTLTIEAPENDLLSYVPSADAVFQNHLFSEDEDAAVEVLSPDRESSGWVGRAGSITKHEGEYYIVERSRVGNDGRGRYIRAHKRTGAGFSADNWVMQWEVDSNSTDVAAISFEELTVRNYDNTWYLYISYTDEPGWQVAYVSAPTFSELESQLSDSANWETILVGNGEKDPKVQKVAGDYYMNYQELGDPNYELPLIKSGTPDFDSFTTIEDSIMEQFVNQHGSAGDTNPGTLVYDAENELYILWVNAVQGDNVYSVYAVSPDLTEDSFSYTNRDLEFSAPVSTSDFRYPDHHSPSDSGTVLIFEYSGLNFPTNATVNENSLYLWDYLDAESSEPDLEPAFFEVSDLDPPTAAVEPDDTLDVSATITNTGDLSDEQDVELLIDGNLVDSETLSVDPTDPETVTFEEVSTDDLEEGEYEHKIASEDDDATGTLIVATSETTRSEWNNGTFDGTSADRNNHSGNLGLGYISGNSDSVDTTQPLDGLVGQWSLDESYGTNSTGDMVMDHSGNDNDGTTQGNVDTTRTGPFSTNAYGFAGDDEHLEVTGNVFDATQGVSFAFWFKWDGNPYNTHSAYITDRNDTSNNWSLQVWNPEGLDGSVRLQVSDGTGNDDFAAATDANAVDIDQWNFIVVTYDAETDEGTIYIDAEQEAQGTSDVSASQVDSGVMIGSYFNNNGRGIRGDMAEIMVFEGNVLSQAEVEQLYLDGMDGTFEGEYTVETLSEEEEQSWVDVETVSTIGEDTSVDMTVEVSDNNFSTVKDSQTITLSGGTETHDLDVANATDARVRFDGDSTDVNSTWVIYSFSVNYESAGDN